MIKKRKIGKANLKITELGMGTASGKFTKSEINGYGDDEFNSWVIGATI